MAKRKSLAPDPELDSDNEDASERSLVDVDFEFFDPHPDVDYLALKRLATQLLQGDAEPLHVNDLADLILSQPLVGTTVKCDGRESDPYAVLTVLNMRVHQNHPSIKALTEYALTKSSADPAFHGTLQTLLNPASSNHVGFVFSERLINMPVQIMPHMYRMLADEIQWALDDNEPYNFTHLLIISRIYRLSPEEEAELQGPASRSKRQKQTAQQPPSRGVYPFHPEDEQIQKIAVHSLDYNFTNTKPREENGFGLDMGGRMMLVPASRLRDLVSALQDAYPPPS
ncbi:p21-C-terminal region-binding protein-domain-containing protein [Fomitopsis serialis]|uniref:p21-C-terminal region-binding protein-domain-containing protein n=1 Tax=Fomitopsis serialis TaxID=139415 RepID=UPI0020074752|nr:p21-C-terminal region-binding protein-domain-containing protein [Neoantrodia serialis]KAH9911650.1 p21-C-terminal region-binding protein-domain-containing protein [Neoantrodia serialis]